MSRRSPQLQVLPEMFGGKVPAAPTVLIDASLGIPPEATGFDFDRFYDLARTNDYTEEEIGTHTQHFSGRRTLFSLGRHRGRTATIFVRNAVTYAQTLTHKKPEDITKEYGVDIYRDPTPASIVNETSVHEFGHDHDCLHQGGRRDTRVHITRQGTALLATLGGIADMIAETTAEQSGYGVLVAGAATMASAGIALSLNRGPLSNYRTEGVAYRFQEQYGSVPIVNFDPVLLGNLVNGQQTADA